MNNLQPGVSKPGVYSIKLVWKCELELRRLIKTLILSLLSSRSICSCEPYFTKERSLKTHDQGLLICIKLERVAKLFSEKNTHQSIVRQTFYKIGDDFCSSVATLSSSGRPSKTTPWAQSWVFSEVNKRSPE